MCETQVKRETRMAKVSEVVRTVKKLNDQLAISPEDMKDLLVEKQ